MLTNLLTSSNFLPPTSLNLGPRTRLFIQTELSAESSVTKSDFRFHKCVASNALEDGTDALPSADAHGHECKSAADALKFVNRLRGDDRAGRADGMTQGNA